LKINVLHHKLKKNNHIVILVNVEKSRCHNFYDKNSKNRKKELSQFDKEHLQKTSTANIILNDKVLDAFPTRSQIRTVLEVITYAIRYRKRMKGI
jgi:hypothetical protein